MHVLHKRPGLIYWNRLKTKLKSSRKLKKQFHRIQGQIDNLSNTKI